MICDLAQFWRATAGRGYILAFMWGMNVRFPRSMYMFWCSLSGVISLLFLINSELKVSAWNLLLRGRIWFWRWLPYSKVLSQKLIVCRLVKKFSAFYRAPKFTAFFYKKSLWMDLILNLTNPPNIHLHYSLMVHFNIILSSIFLRRCLPFRNFDWFLLK